MREKVGNTMKIDRLIGILSILLQKEKVTAPYLAEKFEVSRRTISRDIEAISQAGIPIVTTQGIHGGISIMEGYRMDRTLLTSADMQAILAGLRSLDSVSGTGRYQQLMEKLSPEQSGILTSNSHILINLSSWYKSTLTPKIELIQEAAERKERIAFTYYAPGGETARVIEPYYLIFQWSSWYVWGYCMERADFRLFKLNRLMGLKSTGEFFEARQLPPFPMVHCKRGAGEQIKVTVRFEASCKWRLIEEYGADSFLEEPEGTLLFQFTFLDRANLIQWILSFGDKAELLKPENLRREFEETAEKIKKKYKT